MIDGPVRFVAHGSLWITHPFRPHRPFWVARMEWIRHHRGMVTDFFDSIRRSFGSANGLRRRRIVYVWRRLLCAAAASVAVFAALMCVVTATATRMIVVAAVDIEYGTVIDPDMVRVTAWPSSDSLVLPNVFVTMEEIPDGGIAQVDIGAGQPLFRPMIRDQPSVPDGFTVIEVHLASDTGALIPGDTVALASLAGCEGSHDAGASSEQSCILVEHAMVMTGRGTKGASSETSSGNYDARSLTMLAMPPDDALRVMASQEAGAVVAVARRER